jgi:putative transposase
MIYYSTDLLESQWQVIKGFLNTRRKRKHDLRHMFDAICYLIKTGCQWRMLPKSYPKWEIVYYYFTCWKHGGIIEKIQNGLSKMVRVKQGRKEQPSAAIIDAQSVKSTLVSSRAHTGYDGGKKIKGIKRHVVVDTQGNLLCMVVHSAGMSDRKGAALVLKKLKAHWPEIKILFADGSYPLVGKAHEPGQELCGYPLEVVKRSGLNTFEVVPKRWVVERTFAWGETNRRNAKYFERYPCTAEAVMQLSAIRIMLKQF